jgi:DNA invertase Pin-like site-specific DNA recombinase
MKRASFRCAIYTRKSSSEGLDMDFNSLDAQREACAAYILSQAGEGWRVIDAPYDDGGYSGGSMERPALQRLIADIAAKRVDIVVVYKVDRLTRSLSDFAKIVDVFDAAGASFVSVTQAFNTTTSMGRLTLNMLLSFAQFEREVTGERIRDKIAASKQKGMWMGGNPPLGYDVRDRALVVNDAEATLVRAIFTRYLETPSVLALRDALEAEGVRSKQWTSRSGRSVGGHVLSRGAIFHLLANRIYLGEISHRGQIYPGRHAAIIDRDLFERVADKLKARGPIYASRRTRAPTHALIGRVLDDKGHPMSPSHARKNRVRYHYYVSGAVLEGRRADAGSLPRVSALALEVAIADIIRAQVDLNADQHPLADVERVDVSRDSLRVTLKIGDASRIIDTPIQLKFRNSAMLIQPEGQATTRRGVDRALVRALARATDWAARLESGEYASIDALARAEQRCERHTSRILPLAYLAPDLVAAILDGRQPPALTLAALTEPPLPLSWDAQRRRFAAFA